MLLNLNLWCFTSSLGPQVFSVKQAKIFNHSGPFYSHHSKYYESAIKRYDVVRSKEQHVLEGTRWI